MPISEADLVAGRALLLEENLIGLAKSMRLRGRNPDEIEKALRDQNDFQAPSLNAESLDSIIARSLGDYRNAYSPRLINVAMSGFMRAEYPPPRFVIDQLIPCNEVTLGGGHGGSGKSILFLALAAHVAAGQSWAGFDVTKCRVIFVSLEDPANHVMHRLQKVIKEYMLDPVEIERNLLVIDGTSDPELMIDCAEYGAHQLVATQTLQEVKTAAAGAGLIIIDNASDAFGGNENARREVRAFVRELAKIARENDAGLVLLAHIDKAAARHGGHGNSYSGSTAWHNSVRSRLALVEADGALKLDHEKHNRSRRAEPIPLDWTDDGVLVPLRAASVAASRALQVQADANLALIAMRAAHSAGIRVTAAASGPATSWHALQCLPEMEAFGSKKSKNRLHSALVSLQGRGHLVRTPYRDVYRKEREAWSLTDSGLETASEIAP